MISALMVDGGFAVSLSVLQMQYEPDLRLPILIFPLVDQVIQKATVSSVTCCPEQGLCHLGRWGHGIAVWG